MAAKPTKPRAARRGKAEAADVAVAAEDVAAAAPEAVVLVPARVTRSLPAVAARLVRNWHFTWFEALLPRLTRAEARAAVWSAGNVVVPERVLAALRSQAEARTAGAAPDLDQAEALAEAGDLTGAVAMARLALQSRSGDAGALLRLARLLRRAGMDVPAQAALRASVLADGEGALLDTWLGPAPARAEPVAAHVAVVEAMAAPVVAAAPAVRRRRRDQA